MLMEGSASELPETTVMNNLGAIPSFKGFDLVIVSMKEVGSKGIVINTEK